MYGRQDKTSKDKGGFFSEDVILFDRSIALETLVGSTQFF